MYVPETVASMLARSEVVVVATINGIHYSAGEPVAPPMGPDGRPPAPGTLLPRQPDQIIGLTVLNVLAGTLPDGPLTIYKVNERFWIGDEQIGQRWLFFLSRQNSGRWRTVVSFTPDAVDEVRAELAALSGPIPASPRLSEPPVASPPAARPRPERRPQPPDERAPGPSAGSASKTGVWASLRRTFGLD